MQDNQCRTTVLEIYDYFAGLLLGAKHNFKEKDLKPKIIKRHYLDKLINHGGNFSEFF